MKAVIVAGGKGTRVHSVSKSLPKSLLKINGTTVIEHQLNSLRKEGINEVVFSLGHMSDIIIDFLEKNDNFGMNAKYVIETSPMGTAGNLPNIENLGKTFLLIYGDIIFDIFIQRFLNYHEEKNSDITLLTHPNDHPFDSDLVQSNLDGKVTSFLMKNKRRGLYNNCVNAGIYLVNNKIFSFFPNSKCDLVNDILPILLNNNLRIFTYNSSEFVKDMGTPERMNQIEASLKLGLTTKKNFRNSQSAVFLDRDGVINEEVNQLINHKDFKLIDKSSKAIKKLNESNFLSIVVTNQPAVAKGFCDLDNILLIHKKMETILGEMGTKLDSIFFCPHHPEKGFPNENKEFKIKCGCRKPETGMLFKAKRIFNIDFSSSYIVGDSTSDILAGKRAGVKTILVRTGYAGKDNKYDVKADYIVDNLFDAVEKIILKEKK